MATEADVVWWDEALNNRLCELVDGVLVIKAASMDSAILTVAVMSALAGYERPRNVGVVLGPDGAKRLWPGRFRIPDVSFTGWDRYPSRRLPRNEAIGTAIPELVVEVLAEGNTPREMLLKRRDYFQVGVRLYWEIDPEARTADVYASLDGVYRLTEADALDGGDVLPGFTLPLAELFAELDCHG